MENPPKKKLAETTPADVVAWADKHYRPVLNKFGEDPPDGLTLSKLKEQNFKDAYGPTVGPAFYNTLGGGRHASTSFSIAHLRLSHFVVRPLSPFIF